MKRSPSPPALTSVSAASFCSRRQIPLKFPDPAE